VAHPSGEEFAMKTAAAAWLEKGRHAASEYGPYAAVALLVPGGSVVAALAWLYHRCTAPKAPR
jgi:hypothetical protein